MRSAVLAFLCIAAASSAAPLDILLDYEELMRDLPRVSYKMEAEITVANTRFPEKGPGIVTYKGWVLEERGEFICQMRRSHSRADKLFFDKTSYLVNDGKWMGYVSRDGSAVYELADTRDNRKGWAMEYGMRARTHLDYAMRLDLHSDLRTPFKAGWEQFRSTTTDPEHGTLELLRVGYDDDRAPYEYAFRQTDAGPLLVAYIRRHPTRGFPVEIRRIAWQEVAIPSGEERFFPSRMEITDFDWDGRGEIHSSDIATITNVEFGKHDMPISLAALGLCEDDNVMYISAARTISKHGGRIVGDSAEPRPGPDGKIEEWPDLAGY